MSLNRVCPTLCRARALSCPHVSTLSLTHVLSESGRNTAPAHIGRREMQEVFLPVFEKAVRAGALGAMSSYNEVDGVPTSSDHWLLTEQLRETFGFTG